MTKIYIKVGTDQIVAIGECHTEVELKMDKIIGEGHSMIKITENISGKEILEECKFIEVRILEVDIQVALGMIILEEVKVGLDRGSIQVTFGGMIEASVDQDQVQEQLPTEIESDTLSVGSMIILPKTFQIYQIQKKNSQGRYSKCST